MGAYLAVSYDPDHPGAETLSNEVKRLAGTHASQTLPLGRFAWMAATGPHPPKVLAIGSWMLIGDVFDRHRPTLPWVAEDDPYLFERKLVARVWGRYVGVQISGQGGICNILRDPSGAFEAIAWVQDGVTIVTSTLPQWLIKVLKPDWRIDFTALEAALRDPLVASGDIPLLGPTTVAPGTVQPLPLDRAAQSVWSPLAFARRGRDRALGQTEAETLLRSSLDEAVRGLAGLAEGLAAEVSGGLDSGIVAASLVHGAPGVVRNWFNAHGTTPESDERRFVAALATKLGIAPQSVPLAVGAVTEALLERISGDVRPGLNALDMHHDLDWAQRIPATGAGAIMTGKGGDGILVQAATGDVFTDLWLHKRWRALGSRDVVPLARGNEVSVWTLVREARAFGRTGPRRPTRDTGLLRPAVDAPAIHPWLDGAEAFGPAKTFQIAAAIDNISRHGPSLQTEVIDVLHPLCAQPVVEACLTIPTPMMTVGGRDRGLARQTFADRLPKAILDRRSKGDLTRIYGRMILDSLPFLRPWLLDGRLAARGILDRAAADDLLTRESLMWRGAYGEIMIAAVSEAWVRVWEARLGRRD